ncbi:MAG: hypothetical protein ACRCXT_20085 [Paraclostridium sp.]
MYNYYQYCKNISNSYYPKVYFKLEKHINETIKSVDKSKMYPFPNINQFEMMVKQILNKYKNELYKDVIEGKEYTKTHINYSNDTIEDLIRILLVNKIMKDRERYKNYPYYY